VLLLYNCLLLAVVSVAGVGEGEYSTQHSIKYKYAMYAIKLGSAQRCCQRGDVSSLVSNDCCL
jgi:hypothetical protein